jgi:hypothetical protein
MIPKDKQEFEEWWDKHGQFCRAGGGDYEKTFAFHAWERHADKFNSEMERTVATLNQAKEALESCQEGNFRDNGFDVWRKDYDSDAVSAALAAICKLDGAV